MKKIEFVDYIVPEAKEAYVDTAVTLYYPDVPKELIDAFNRLCALSNCSQKQAVSTFLVAVVSGDILLEYNKHRKTRIMKRDTPPNIRDFCLDTHVAFKDKSGETINTDPYYNRLINRED